jgi:hypothetical protein
VLGIAIPPCRQTGFDPREGLAAAVHLVCHCGHLISSVIVRLMHQAKSLGILLPQALLALGLLLRLAR